MQPAVAAHPGDLPGRAQEAGDGETLGAQHQQDGKPYFQEDGGVWGHGSSVM